MKILQEDKMAAPLLDLFYQSAGRLAGLSVPTAEELFHYSDRLKSVMEALGLRLVTYNGSGDNARMTFRTPLEGPNQHKQIQIICRSGNLQGGKPLSFESIINGFSIQHAALEWHERETRLIDLIASWMLQHGGPDVQQKLRNASPEPVPAP